MTTIKKKVCSLPALKVEKYSKVFHYPKEDLQPFFFCLCVKKEGKMFGGKRKTYIGRKQVRQV